MSSSFSVRHLDVPRFCRDGASLQGDDVLSNYERLIQEAHGPASSTGPMPVSWQAEGALHQDVSGHTQHALHLQAHARLPMVCQRCLTPVEVDLRVDQHYRFVASEDQAMEEDDASEEDLLVLTREFDLHELVEDELLMALPLVPRHEVCPGDLKMSAQDADFEAHDPKAKPFAMLAALKAGTRESND